MLELQILWRSSSFVGRLEFGLTSAILRTSITLDGNSGIKCLGFLKRKRDLKSFDPHHQLSRRLGIATSG